MISSLIRAASWHLVYLRINPRTALVIIFVIISNLIKNETISWMNHVRWNGMLLSYFLYKSPNNCHKWLNYTSSVTNSDGECSSCESDLQKHFIYVQPIWNYVDKIDSPCVTRMNSLAHFSFTSRFCSISILYCIHCVLFPALNWSYMVHPTEIPYIQVTLATTAMFVPEHVAVKKIFCYKASQYGVV